MEAVESARAGLSQKRKEEDQGRWSVSTGRRREKEEKKTTKEGGLSPQEGDLEKVPEKKKTKEGKKVAPRRKGSVCPQPRNFFFWFTSIWILSDRLVGSIGSYETLSTRKPCAKEVPATDYFTQQKQYLKRTTLRTY